MNMNMNNAATSNTRHGFNYSGCNPFKCCQVFAQIVLILSFTSSFPSMLQHLQVSSSLSHLWGDTTTSTASLHNQHQPILVHAFTTTFVLYNPSTTKITRSSSPIKTTTLSSQIQISSACRKTTKISSSDDSSNESEISRGSKSHSKGKSTKSTVGSGGGFGTSSSSVASPKTNNKSSSSSTNRIVKRTTKALNSFPYSGTVLPGKISPQQIVTDSTIIKPDYWDTGIPKKTKSNTLMLPWMIEVKTPSEIEAMKVSGLLARYILDEAGKLVEPGITTDEIDRFVHDLIVKNKAYPSPLNYHGFPKSCCTSVNEVICHGIPDDRKLEVGDIINLDITVYKDGYHGDCSEMFVVGPIEALPSSSKKLLQATYDCWISACSIVRPGVDFKQIGSVIEDYITPQKLTTVKKFCGHGIGSIFHTNPNILHYRNNEPNGVMAPGHTFTIEPMICEGISHNVVTWPDDWTATTGDGKRSAQFEHTLLVTPDGVEALTGKTIASPIQFWERDSKVHTGIWLGTTPAAVQKMKEINSARATATGSTPSSV